MEDAFNSKFELNLYYKSKSFEDNIQDIVLTLGLQSLVHFNGLTPRFLIEGIALTALILFFLFSDNASGFLGFIGVLALSAQRLMPLVQVIYAGRTAMAGNGTVDNLSNFPKSSSVVKSMLMIGLKRSQSIICVLLTATIFLLPQLVPQLVWARLLSLRELRYRKSSFSISFWGGVTSRPSGLLG